MVILRPKLQRMQPITEIPLIAHDISVAKIVRDTSQNDDHNLCDPLIGKAD